MISSYTDVGTSYIRPECETTVGGGGGGRRPQTTVQISFPTNEPYYADCLMDDSYLHGIRKMVDLAE